MSTALATIPPDLQQALNVRGIDAAQWSTLTNSLYPGARPESALMVIDYCRARKLDPMKKPCHIVPMRVKDAKSGTYDWRDVVMPGIYEYRTTAMRTGQYLGHSPAEYGPDKAHAGVSAPEWCEMTIYRLGPDGQRIEFPVRVYFREAVVLKDGKANDRWAKAPIQMLTKCTEAAGLREAFPDEFGGESTADEMEGREMGGSPIDVTPIVPLPQALGPAAPTAPATSQPEPSAPATRTAPALELPTTPNTAFRRDNVRIVKMELGQTADKTNTETGEVTPGRKYALVTLDTDETFQCWHMNTLAPQLEAWKDAKVRVDLDCSTARDTKFRPRIEKGAAV